MPELPTYLITLRQFWRLCTDCSVVDGDCTLADAGRIFTFSCRETELEGIDDFERTVAKGQDGYALRLRAVREQQGIDSVEQLPQLWGMMDDGKGGQRKGWHIVGAFDVENPHHPNNRQHLFRFFETILRVAHKQLHAEKKNLANCFDSFVTETIFPNACNGNS